MKQDTFLILKLLITFLKELVVDQGSLSAICTGIMTRRAFANPHDCAALQLCKLSMLWCCRGVLRRTFASRFVAKSPHSFKVMEWKNLN